MVYCRELRYTYCKKLLTKDSGNVQVKCSRCKAANTFNQTAITKSTVEHHSKVDFGTPAGVPESR